MGPFGIFIFMLRALNDVPPPQWAAPLDYGLHKGPDLSLYRRPLSI